jgi:chitinase
MRNKFNLLALAMLFVLGVVSSGFCQFKVVGYTPSWGNNISTIQYNKLTHINYAFVLPNANGSLQGVDGTKLSSLVSDAHASNVKVLIAVGGWNDGDDSAFETLAANSTSRDNLVNNLVNLVNQYGLDGVDIDWEYPNDGSSATNFSTLMSQLSTAMHSRGKLLTAAVVATGGSSILNSVFGYVDYLNLMAYDGGGSNHSTYDYAVQSLNYWTGRGLPASKAVIGVPFYGRSSSEYVSYSDILARGGNPNADFFNGIGYNGIPTIKSKTNLAFDRSAGGIMIWELSQDVNNQNSLLTAINEVVVARSGGGVPSNLAKGKPVTVSSTEAGSNVGANAVDGSYATRWSSTYADNQWVRIDLGSSYNVNRVKITWEAAYSSNYRIEVSADGSTGWTAIKTVSNKTSAAADDWTGLSGTGRYLRVWGVTRATQWGISIFEIETYGTPSGGGTSNLALNKTVTTTSNENTTYTGSKAVDGNTATRWSSAYANNQNFIVDLGASYNISRVRIAWEAAYARDYQVQFSTNNINWTTVRELFGKTSAAADDWTGINQVARYVKVYCINRATTYGFSFWELEVYEGSAGGGIAQGAQEITAEHSIEVQAYPNPARDNVTVKFSSEWQQPEGGIITLHDASGKQLVKNDMHGDQHTFDLSELPTGLYFIQLRNMKRREVAKLFKVD